MRGEKLDLSDLSRFTSSPNKTYNEIKPLSPSGIYLATAQMITRAIQFGPLGFEPDEDWPAIPRTTFAGSEPILYFNLAGVIFYTSALDLAEDVLAYRVLGFAPAAWKLLSSSFNNLVTALERIPQLVGAGRSADGARVQGQFSISTLLSSIGGFAI